tara:strand:+ start:1761 stop:1994 length:234 start_codon:yes stop_codon:yes gene_type:complete
MSKELKAITILVPMDEILAEVESGNMKSEFQQDIGRTVREVPFEFCSFMGYEVDDTEADLDDEIHEALVGRILEGAA